MNNLLSVEEVKRYLEVEDGQVQNLIHAGKLRAYKIGGAYLRFRKEEVLSVKQEIGKGAKNTLSIPWFLRLRDFWRFNNFYLISLLLIVVLLYIVVFS